MLQWQAGRAPALDDGARFRTGAVVGDDDFIRQVRLPRYAREGEVQGIGPVVRRYDQAAAHQAGLVASSATWREHAALSARAKARGTAGCSEANLNEMRDRQADRRRVPTLGLRMRQGARGRGESLN
jgi:hypothetical protein